MSRIQAIAVGLALAFFVAGCLEAFSNDGAAAENQHPIAEIASVAPSPANLGEPVTFTGNGSDADGEIVLYYWHSSIDDLLSLSPEFTTTELAPGLHTITLRVLDHDGAWSEPVTTTLAVIGNLAPVATIVSIGPLAITAGESVTFSGSGSDADGEVVAYRWMSSRDSLLSEEAVFSSDELSEGIHVITFEVQDDKGTWSDSAVMIIDLAIELAYPTAILTATKRSDGTYSIQVIKVTRNEELTYYSFILSTDYWMPYAYGEIAIQNLSGDIVGIESSDLWDIKNPSATGDMADYTDDVEDETGDCASAACPVVFYDNDRDDRLTAGDQFIIRGVDYDTGYEADNDWWFKIRYDPNGAEVGSVVLP